MRDAALVLALAGVLAQGCGGGSADASPDDFVGVWIPTGTATTRCGMGAGVTNDLAESVKTITITKGQTAPLVVVVGDCSLLMDIHGTTAMLRPGQMCTVMRKGISSTATYSGGDFMISGITATFHLAASFTSGEGAIVLSCSYEASGNATKMAK